MALNDSLTIFEKSKLAVWDYPVSDKFTKVALEQYFIIYSNVGGWQLWYHMRQVGFVDNVTAGVERVRKSTSSTEGFAFIAEATQVNFSIKGIF